MTKCKECKFYTDFKTQNVGEKEPRVIGCCNNEESSKYVSNPSKDFGCINGEEK
jgi:hypothetical protein